jgi:hypothetical protein
MRGTELPPQRSLRTYPSLAAFYSADERRIASRERDVGLWWREAVDGPLHRAAWVSDTGELYLVRLGPAEEGGASSRCSPNAPARTGSRASLKAGASSAANRAR